MKRPMKRRQSGFTLVEIAIVLVIIGLLLGGVLKGQELINSAKSKAVINDFRNTATMIAAYQDRFRALPGDDKSASTHLNISSGSSSSSSSSSGGSTSTVDGDGDGQIEGAWDATTGTSQTGFTHESSFAWQHLRLANLASGSAGTPSSGDWEPKNSEGGRVGIQSAVPFTGMRGRVFVCQGNLSGRIAQQVDTTMDDGKPNSGSVQFGTAVSAAAAASIDENTLYIVCASF